MAKVTRVQLLMIVKNHVSRHAYLIDAASAVTKVSFGGDDDFKQPTSKTSIGGARASIARPVHYSMLHAACALLKLMG